MLQTSNNCLSHGDSAIVYRDISSGKDVEPALDKDVKKTFQQQFVLEASSAQNDVVDAGCIRQLPNE
jgi:hypothetical protein